MATVRSFCSPSSTNTFVNRVATRVVPSNVRQNQSDQKTGQTNPTPGRLASVNHNPPSNLSNLTSSTNSPPPRSSFVSGSKIVRSITNAKQQLSVAREQHLLKKPEIDPDDFDVLTTDITIKKYLTSRKHATQQLQEKIGLYTKMMANGDLSTKPIAASEIHNTRIILKDIETTSELGLYIFLTSEIIEKYKKIANANTNVRISFVGSSQNEIPSDVTKCVSELKNNFVVIAKKFANVLPSKKKNCVPLRCGNCESVDVKVSLDDDSIYTCSNCWAEFEVFVEGPSSFKDAARVNMTTKYKYTCKGHFTEAIKKIMGEQNINPDKIQEALDVIHEEIEFHEMTKERNQPNSVTKDDIHRFLTNRKLSAHYDNIWLLNKIITGEPCPDIGPYVPMLLDDFDKLKEALDKLKDESRVNSLLVFYKIFILLLRRGFKCRKADFHILKTEMKEEEHEEKMKAAFKICGWEWVNPS